MVSFPSLTVLCSKLKKIGAQDAQNFELQGQRYHNMKNYGEVKFVQNKPLDDSTQSRIFKSYFKEGRVW